MRHRRRTRVLPGVTGREYSWLVTWHETQFHDEPSVKIPTWIIDDTGRHRVNPLHAFDAVIDRPVTQIDANDGFGRYIGGVAVDAQYLVYQASSVSSAQDLQAWATKGLARSKPIRPYLNLAREIAELRDVSRLVRNVEDLCTFVRRSYTASQGKRVFRDLLNQVGDQTLAVMFGVFPLVDSLAKLGDLTLQVDRRVKAIVRHEGQWQHKRVTLLDDRDTTSTVLSDPVYPLKQLKTYIVSNTGTKVFETRDRIWYETDVKYRIPGRPSTKHKWLMDKLLGRQITPTLLWEVTPFSWLLDWFVDVRSFYLSIEDSTVYSWKMSCIMHNTEATATVYANLEYRTPSGIKSLPVEAYTKLSAKRRFAHTSNRIGFTPTELDSFYRQLVTGAFVLKSL